MRDQWLPVRDQIDQNRPTRLENEGPNFQGRKMEDRKMQNWKCRCGKCRTRKCGTNFSAWIKLRKTQKCAVYRCITYSAAVYWLLSYCCWGWSPANIRINFISPETRRIVITDAENRTIVGLSSFVWKKTPECDGHGSTDRRKWSSYSTALVEVFLAFFAITCAVLLQMQAQYFVLLIDQKDKGPPSCNRTPEVEYWWTHIWAYSGGKRHYTMQLCRPNK